MGQKISAPERLLKSSKVSSLKHITATALESLKTTLLLAQISLTFHSPHTVPSDAVNTHVFHRAPVCSMRMSSKDSLRWLFARVAARRDAFPDDPQTLKDYGFDRATTNTDRSKLLGLYIGLFNLDVDPKDVNRWLVTGTLVKEIKAAFDALPAASRGGYYPWFLSNQYILDGSLPLPVSIEEHVNDVVVRAWRFTGGSTKDSAESIRAKISQMPRTTQSCHNLYAALLTDPMSHPHPSLDSWVEFGFCTCPDMFSEGSLGVLYHRLIEQCTFKEFVQAYETGKLAKLIDSKHLRGVGDFALLDEVLDSAGGMIKSVWYLKQFVEVEEPDFPPANPIVVDYGFMNCKDATEFEDLKALYKQILDMPKASPLDLHKACIQGKLFEFVDNLVLLKKKVTRKQLRRILKNPYPLPDL
ncbi:hypothetical protein DXG01_007705 [Tephrocybe rancida]|nr:hypothetical protein DXG01_007705 [Tephrocybe rancida]